MMVILCSLMDCIITMGQAMVIVKSQQGKQVVPVCHWVRAVFELITMFLFLLHQIFSLGHTKDISLKWLVLLLNQMEFYFVLRLFIVVPQKKYVLWFNWINGSDFSQSYYAVATSNTPLGPFTLVTTVIKTLAYDNTGDFALFVDDDGKAYIIYTAHIQGYDTTHQMSIEQLSDDYTYTLGSAYSSGFFGASFVEAPTMFKRDNLYYASFGSCCCYCKSGSAPGVYTSSKPLGPYTTQTSLGNAMSSQQTNVLPYKTNQSGSIVMGYLWQGDRWQSAPDGIKGHDFSYWQPLSFDSQGRIQSPLVWVDSFTIDVQY